jgi:hypothetical protein
MTTALDTSVLLAVFNGETDASAWMDRIIRWRREGPLVVCAVVWAECSPAFPAEAAQAATLEKLGIRFDPILPSAAWQAGRVFKTYRDEKGPREHLIPDFLIAAHAEVQCDRLAAIDRGYYRRYFKQLRIVGL